MKPECVVMDPPVKKKEEVIRCLVDCLVEHYEIKNPEKLSADIFDRENLVSTCVGHGCALPHARSSALDTTVFAAARLQPPGEFDAPDGEPVSLVFLMAGPESSTGLHIRLISRVARLLNDASFRDELRGAATAQEFYESLCRKDE
jgi:mannitol/fructose-specific phosphotransferase system IIA component (Ntr-type)